MPSSAWTYLVGRLDSALVTSIVATAVIVVARTIGYLAGVGTFVAVSSLLAAVGGWCVADVVVIGFAFRWEPGPMRLSGRLARR